MSPKLSGEVFIVLFLSLILACSAEPAFAARPIQISPNNIPDGTVSVPYSVTLTASRGISPYTWSITAGSLPPGLFFTPAPSPSLTADISGTPTLSGTFTFDVTLTDSDNPRNSTTDTYKVTVKPPCSFSGPNIGGISFGTIDPSISPTVISGTITQQIFIVCRNNMSYTVTASPASGWTIAEGADAIPITLNYNTGGVGTGAPVPLVNSVQITQPYMNAVAGLHANGSDIVFTISWTLAGGGSIIAYLPAGTVSGTVINTCVVSQAPGTLTFTIDPSIVGSTSASISPDMQIRCTKNAGITVTASSACGGAAPRMASGYPPVCGAATIPYTFNFLSSITGQGFGTGISMGIGGSAASADYANAPVGNYGDQQTLTITY